MTHVQAAYIELRTYEGKVILGAARAFQPTSVTDACVKKVSMKNSFTL